MTSNVFGEGILKDVTTFIRYKHDRFRDLSMIGESRYFKSFTPITLILWLQN